MVLSGICQDFFSETKYLFRFYTKNVHWFLIPATAFAFGWCFLEKRKSFKTNILGSRPALYRVINLLDGGIRDRWGTSFILGAMTTLVTFLTYRILVSDNYPLWATVLMVYVQALEATFLALPFFVCLTTRFQLLGGIVGLLYAFVWAALSLYNCVVPVKCFMELRSNLQQMNFSDISPDEKSIKIIYDEFADISTILIALIELPAHICFICIVGKFITRIYDCIKTGEYTRQDKNELSVKNYEIYVKYLMDPAGQKPTQRILRKYLERIIHNVPGFTYSNPIFSTAFVMAILMYQVILAQQYVLKMLSKAPSVSHLLKILGLFDILQGCSIACAIATGIYGCIVFNSILTTYKQHMLMLYKGERGFLPEGTEKERPEKHLVRSIQYMGTQIIGMLYGAISCFFVLYLPLSLLCIVCRLSELSDKVPQLLEQFQILVYPISVFIIFRLHIFIVGKFLLQERLNTTDPRRPLAIDNRKAHDLFKFFMLFVNMSVGILVLLRRTISNIFLGICLVPRMDRSMFPKGFESGDKCFMSYVGMLMVDFTHNNPIMRLFCSLLLKTVTEKHNQRSDVHTTAQNPIYGEIEVLHFPRQYQGLSRARTKWLLAYTLINNPSIAGKRKHAVPGVVQIEPSEFSVDVVDRVQQAIGTTASTLFIYIGVIVIFMIIVFLYFGYKTILTIQTIVHIIVNLSLTIFDIISKLFPS